MDAETTNGAVDALAQASGWLEAAAANPEPLVAIGTLGALGIAAAKRFGGGRFVLLVEALPIASDILTTAGGLVRRTYDQIKGAQKPPSE